MKTKAALFKSQSADSKSYTVLINKLTALLSAEHIDFNDAQLTDDIAQSYMHGFGLWSLYLYKSSGAASDEFHDLYAELTNDAVKHKRFMSAAERERDAFVDTVAHADCPHCGAVVWHAGQHGSTLYCESCASDFGINKQEQDDE